MTTTPPFTIAIGSDHAGYEMKQAILKHFVDNHVTFKDFGTNSTESVDYPDYAHPVAQAVAEHEAKWGIVICGSGNGVNMTVNKYQQIRSALCWNKTIAELARLHNDANILALPARFISIEEAIEIVDIFLKTNFEGGRHQQRIEKISIYH